MKAKRLTALLLLVVTLIGMLPGAALAANTPEEALGEISIYNGGEQLAYLAVNGRVQKLNYVYFEHNSANRNKANSSLLCQPHHRWCSPGGREGRIHKIPGRESGYQTPRSWALWAMDILTVVWKSWAWTMYSKPTMPPRSLCGAIWRTDWSIDKVTIAPGLSEHEQQIAQRLLAAAKDIYNRGSGWTDVLIPGLTVSADQQNAYEVQINGETYLQQVYTIESGTWVDGLEISIWFDSEDVPDGMKIRRI